MSQASHAARPFFQVPKVCLLLASTAQKILWRPDIQQAHNSVVVSIVSTCIRGSDIKTYELSSVDKYVANAHYEVNKCVQRRPLNSDYIA